jgi:hypothetical protein
MTQHSFNEHNQVTLLDPPASQVGASSSWVQPFVDGVGADRAVFMLVTGVVATNDVVLTLNQAQDSAGTGSKVITGATTTVLNGSTGEIQTIEIGPGALDADVDADGNSVWSYVQAEVTSAAAEIWGLIYVRHNLRLPSGALNQDATYSAAVQVYD